MATVSTQTLQAAKDAYAQNDIGKARQLMGLPPVLEDVTVDSEDLYTPPKRTLDSTADIFKAAKDAYSTGDLTLAKQLMAKYKEVEHEEQKGFISHGKNALQHLYPDLLRGVGNVAGALGAEGWQKNLTTEAHDQEKSIKPATENTPDEIAQAEKDNGWLGGVVARGSNVLGHVGDIAGMSPAMVAGAVSSPITAGALGMGYALTKAGELGRREEVEAKATSAEGKPPREASSNTAKLAGGVGEAVVDIFTPKALSWVAKKAGIGLGAAKALEPEMRVAADTAYKEVEQSGIATLEKGPTQLSQVEIAAVKKNAFSAAEEAALGVAQKIADKPRTVGIRALSYGKGTAKSAADMAVIGHLDTGIANTVEGKAWMQDNNPIDRLPEDIGYGALFHGAHAAFSTPKNVLAEKAQEEASSYAPENSPEYQKALDEHAAAVEAEQPQVRPAVKVLEVNQPVPPQSPSNPHTPNSEDWAKVEPIMGTPEFTEIKNKVFEDTFGTKWNKQVNPIVRGEWNNLYADIKPKKGKPSASIYDLLMRATTLHEDKPDVFVAIQHALGKTEYTPPKPPEFAPNTYKTESATQYTTPEQPTPEQPVPEQPAPEQPVPEQPAPEQPAPEQPAPEQPAPEHPAPEQPAPEQPAPEQPAPKINQPQQRLPEELPSPPSREEYEVMNQPTPEQPKDEGLKFSKVAPVNSTRADEQIKDSVYHDGTSKHILTYLTPDEFLSLAEDSKGSAEKRASRKGSFDSAKFSSQQLPFLYITPKGKILDHEGRARAVMAKQAGYSEIPVVLKLPEGVRFSDIGEAPDMLMQQDGIHSVYLPHKELITHTTEFNKDFTQFSKQQSISEAVHTPESFVDKAQEESTKHYGEGWLKSLLGTSKVELTSKEEARNQFGGKVADAKAFYDPKSDKSYFVHDNIDRVEPLMPLFRHEIAGHALRMGKTEPEFQKLLADVSGIVSQDTPLAKKVRQSVIDAKTPEHLVPEEHLAYLLEHHPELPIIKRAVAWFRNALRKLGAALPGGDRLPWNKWVNTLDAKDVAYMAHRALKKAPEDLLFDQPTHANDTLLKASKAGYEGNSQSEAVEWLRAVAKGLDMSHAARMQRAKEMGFDTTQKWYHGTYNKFKEFSATYGAGMPSRSGKLGTISFTQDKNFAENHGRNLLEVLLKNKNTFDYRDPQHQYYAYLELVEQNRRQLKEWGIVNEGKAELDAKADLEKLKHGDYRVIEMKLSPKWYMDSGFDSSYMKEHGAFNINIFDPTKVRSIDAAFDPDYADSANLLASFGGRKAANQIKSATGNTGEFSKTNTDIRYSKKPSKEQAELNAAGYTILNHPEKGKSIGERIVDFTKGAFDQNVKVQNILVSGDKGLSKFTKEHGLRADILGHTLAQLPQVISHVFQMGGIKLNKDGSYHAAPLTIKNHKGQTVTASFADMFKLVDTVPDGRETLNNVAFVLDTAAQLKRDPKKAPERIQKDRAAFAQDVMRVEAIMKQHPEIGDALNMWRAMHGNAVEFMHDTGVINAETKAEFLANTGYFPRYLPRNEIADVLSTTQNKRVKIGQTYTKHFYERTGEDHAVNMLENMLTFLTGAYRTGAVNHTKQAVATQYTYVGAAEHVGRLAPSDKNQGNFAVLVNGKREFYRVADIDSIPSYMAITESMPALIRVAHMATKITRFTQLNKLGFLLKELIRNGMQATMYSNVGFITPIHSFGELAKGLQGKNEAIDILASHGVISSPHVGMGPADFNYFIKHVSEAYQPKGSAASRWHNIEKALNYAHIMVDAATRAAVYRAAMKKGARDGLRGEDLTNYAVMEARETINFAVSGDSHWARDARIVYAFYSSQTNGMLKLYRAATGSDLPVREREAARWEFKKKAGVYAGLSLAYAIYNINNDKYQDVSLEDRTKNILIPDDSAESGFRKEAMPQDLILLHALPQILVDAYSKTKDGEMTLKMLKEYRGIGFETLFAMLPGDLGGAIPFMPGAARPFIEMNLNKDIHTGNPIETERMLHDPVTKRGELTSSKTANYVSNTIGGALGMSPVKIDKMLSSTFGDYGRWALAVSSSMLGDDVVGKPGEGFSLPIYNSRDFTLSSESSQPVKDFYKTKKEIDEHKSYADKLKKERRTTDLVAYKDDKATVYDLSKYKQFDKAAENISKLRNNADMVKLNKNLTDEEKHDKIRNITMQIQVIAKNTMRRYNDER